MLLFLDGMAHYDSSRIAMKYTAIAGSLDGGVDITWTVAPEGRTGNCIKRTRFGQWDSGLDIVPFTTRLGYWTLQKGGVVGFAVKLDDLAQCVQSGYSGYFLAVFEGGFPHLHLSLQGDGTFSLIREGTSSGSILRLGDSIEGLQSGSWAYFESKWVIDDTDGMWETRLNGVPILTYSGPTSSTYSGTYGLRRVWNKVRVLGGGSYRNDLAWRMCDFYLADLQAPSADDVSDFLGDGIIATIRPNAVGASSGWAPTPGTTPNWDTVNDRTVPDDDATYVATTAPGTKDVYNYEDLPSSAIVKAAQWSALVRKESAEGSALVAPVLRQGSTDYVGVNQGIGDALYSRYLTQPYDLNPATGAKFTAGEINAGQFGIQKTG